MRDRIKRAWGAKQLLLSAMVLQGALRIVLKWMPYHKVRAAVMRTSEKSAAPAIRLKVYQEGLIDRTVWAVRATGRFVLGKGPCLPQALAVQWFLSRKGIQTELNIGVKKDGTGVFSAHAWVEKEGKVIIGGAMSPHRFERLQFVES